MKTIIAFLTILLCCFFPPSVFAQKAISLSLDDALKIAETQFKGQDVDYYIYKDDALHSWIIFVDAEPTVDATDLAAGPYLVIYSVSSEIINQRKLILQ